MKALMIAFSMYSRLPMPQFMWEEKDRKRAMYFFPLVGMVVGAMFYVLFSLLEGRGAGACLQAAVLTAVPLLVTGGIHMDGFLDTCDARASYGDRERKLEILKDTHTGAFAVMGGAVYLILYFAACTELTAQSAAAAGLGFILSRALSGLAVVTFPEARRKGMLADFMRDAHKKSIAAAMAVYVILTVCCMAFFGRRNGVISAAAAFGVFFYYRHVALQEFGGVTGDLAGYFLQLCELAVILAPAVLSYFMP